MQYDTFATNDGAEAAAVLKKGKWTEEEDEKLRRAVIEYGVENWVAIEKYSGLARQSKSCRLRWINHLRPNLKKGPFGEDEERIIVQLHHKYGNRWSRIASKLPGRTDNEIKNFWHKRVKKCKKHHRPVYPAAYIKDDQDHTNITNNPKHNENHYTCNEIKVDGKCWLDGNDNSTPINYPVYTIHSHPTHLPDQNEASIMHSNNFPPPFTSSLVEASYPIQASIKQQDVASSNHTQIHSSTNEQFGGFQTSTSQLSPWDHFVASSTIEMPQALMHVSSLSSLQVSSSIATTTTQVPPLNMQSPKSMTSLLGHLTPSPSAPTLSYPNMEPVSLSLDLQPIQPSPSHSFHVTPLNSSFCVKTEHPSIQFSSPQEYGLHKVRSDSNLEIIAARKEAQAKARYRRKTLRQIRIPNKRDFVHEIPSSSSRTEPTDIKCLNMNGTLEPTKLRSDDCVCEFASREGPSSKSIEIFYSQDSFLMEDLFGQNCGTEQVPIFDSLGPHYSQSTATTLLKTEFTESLDRNFIQEQNLQENSKILELHEQNLLYHQYPNLIESGCVMTEPSLESELREGRSGSGLESSPDRILKREYSWDQSLCAESLMATQEQKPLINGLVPSVSQSSITHLLGHNTWNEESCEFTKQVT